MNTAKIFINGRSQAVRLPKEFRFTTKEVYVNKIDDAIVLFPKKDPWALFEKSLKKFTDDYMEKRDQPKGNDKRNNL